MSTSQRVPCIILGCTGVVGQKFIQLLTGHPQFEIVALAASERSANKTYGSVVQWRVNAVLEQKIKDIVVTTCTSDAIRKSGARVCFSALDASVAGDIEYQLAKDGLYVFSNARNHRYDPFVPILIPHVNADHLSIIPAQQAAHGFTTGGFIVTNANCSSTGLVIALKPLADAFGLEAVSVVTMQAISGAGYPGVASLDIIDNIIPFISGEEPKLEAEPLKILGSVNSDSNAFVEAKFAISAHCNRVATIDGHMECVSVKLTKEATVDEVINVLRTYQSEAQHLNLPSAPQFPIAVLDGDNRPQPRLDRELGGGMQVSVGRVRKCPLFSYKFVLCSHNTVVGAAGGSIQNAELALAKGLMK